MWLWNLKSAVSCFLFSEFFGFSTWLRKQASKLFSFLICRRRLNKRREETNITQVYGLLKLSLQKKHHQLIQEHIRYDITSCSSAWPGSPHVLCGLLVSMWAPGNQEVLNDVVQLRYHLTEPGDKGRSENATTKAYTVCVLTKRLSAYWFLEEHNERSVSGHNFPFLETQQNRLI